MTSGWDTATKRVKFMSSIYEGMTDSEKQVANYLREIDLWWVYEFPVAS